MNIISFDIEEWYLEKNYYGNHSERLRMYDNYLNRLLDKLDEKGIRGTFFCVGGMAADFPDIVKAIERRGHEIGCHSFRHTWLNKMKEKEVWDDTRAAVDSLQQCIGKKIKSYRAPAFSIGEDNKWAFEILVDCGIERDASVFPALRDFGGFAQFGQKEPVRIYYKHNSIKEFPICTSKVLGKEVAFSGGGYFRLLPYSYIIGRMEKLDYTMSYFHIEDLVQTPESWMKRKDFEAYYKISGSFRNRVIRYVKENIGKNASFEKILRILDSVDFVNLEQADKLVIWDKQPQVVL